jgi:hypothetical protein
VVFEESSKGRLERLEKLEIDDAEYFRKLLNSMWTTSKFWSEGGKHSEIESM